MSPVLGTARKRACIVNKRIGPMPKGNFSVCGAENAASFALRAFPFSWCAVPSTVRRFPVFRRTASLRIEMATGKSPQPAGWKACATPLRQMLWLPHKKSLQNVTMLGDSTAKKPGRKVDRAFPFFHGALCLRCGR